MVTLEAKLEGVDAAIAKLQALGVDLLDVVEDSLKRGGDRVENQMKEYPSQRPTDYRRTNTLQHAWFADPVVRSGDQLRLNIGNKTKYAPYVQSQVMQANIHRGHWPTDEEILQEELPRMTQEMSAALVRAAGARGGV